MNRIFMAFIEILAAAAFIVPIFLVYNHFLFRCVKRTIMYIIFAFYIVAVVTLVGLPNIQYIRFDVSINIVPLVYMASDLKNSCLNVLLFVPLGIFLPILWNKYRQMKSTVFAGFCATCAIEFLQIFTYRATDIDDILANTLGTLIGYWIIKAATKDFSKFVGSNKKSSELNIILGTTMSVMFLVQPFASNLLWSKF